MRLDFSRHCITVILSALLFFAVSQARGAVPVDCHDRLTELETFVSDPSTNLTENWSSFERAVRSAEKGSARYAPEPYPGSRNEILTDFKYALFEIIDGDAGVSSGARDTLQAARTGDAEYEILRVENWVPTRCGTLRPKPFYFLLRIFSADEKYELGRFVLHDTGLFARFRPFPAKTPRRVLPTEKELLRIVQSTLPRSEQSKVEIEEFEWVALAGLSSCSSVEPCVALHTRSGAAGVQLLLFEPESQRLYELESPVGGLTVSEYRRQHSSSMTALGEIPANPLVSVGFGWSRARLLVDGKVRVSAD